MDFVFPEGCKLVTVEAGQVTAERDLAGQSLSIRPCNARDRVKAQQRARQFDTEPDDELTRLSVTHFCGEPVAQPWTAFGDINMPAFIFLAQSWAEAQGLIKRKKEGDGDPFAATKEVTTP